MKRWLLMLLVVLAALVLVVVITFAADSLFDFGLKAWILDRYATEKPHFCQACSM